MILIYAYTTSPRLQYTCNFIFKELLGVDFAITIDSEEFRNYEGVKINYSDAEIDSAKGGTKFKIHNHALLFENNIKPQETGCFVVSDYKAFFKTINSDWPFDIFAATLDRKSVV